MGNRRFPSVVCKSKKEGKREAADAALRELIAEGEYIASAAANAALLTNNNNNNVNGKKNANGDPNGGMTVEILSHTVRRGGSGHWR